MKRQLSIRSYLDSEDSHKNDISEEEEYDDNESDDESRSDYSRKSARTENSVSPVVKKLVDNDGLPLPDTKPEDFIRVKITTIQREGIDWSIKREASPAHFEEWHKHWMKHQRIMPFNYGGGILAMDMGLGKTLTLLYQVVKDKIEVSREWSGNPNTGNISWSQRIHRPSRRTLVVCGKAHIENVWKKEILQNLVGGIKLRLYIYNSSDLNQNELENADIVLTTYQRVLEDLKNNILPREDYLKSLRDATSESKIDDAWISKRDTLVKELIENKRIEEVKRREGFTRLETINKVLDPFSRLVALPFLKKGLFSVMWWRIILDEAHELRNMCTKRYQAALLLPGSNRWWSSGTPYNNNKSDFAAAVLFLRDNFVSRDDYGHKWTNVEEALNKNIFVETIQKIKSTRPEIIEQEESLSYAKYPCLEFEIAFKFETVQETELHELYIRQLATVAEMLDKKRLNKDQFLNDEDDQFPPQKEEKPNDNNQPRKSALTKEQKLELKLEVLQALEEGATESSMLLKFYTRARQSCLLPVFANPELMKLKKDYFYLGATKIRKVSDYIEQHIPKTDKVLVFSMFVETLDALSLALKMRKIKSLMYVGHQKQDVRDKNIAVFENDKTVKVLLMTYKCGSTGLNLVMANWVILFDPWFNPVTESQAIKRVYRMGQTKPVRVIRFLIAGSIEELVRSNAKKKLKEANTIMKNKGNTKVNMTAAEIIQDVLFLERTIFADRNEEEIYDTSIKLKQCMTVLPPSFVDLSVACIFPYIATNSIQLLPPRSLLWSFTTTQKSCKGNPFNSGIAAKSKAIEKNSTYSSGSNPINSDPCLPVQLDWLGTANAMIGSIQGALSMECSSIYLQVHDAKEKEKQINISNTGKDICVLVKLVEKLRQETMEIAKKATELPKFFQALNYELSVFATPDDRCLEKNVHYVGAYRINYLDNESIFIKGEDAKQDPKLKVSLDIELLLVFLLVDDSFKKIKHNICAEEVRGIQLEYAQNNNWIPIPQGLLKPTNSTTTDDSVMMVVDEEADDELILQNWGSINYIDYTTNILLPALLSEDPCIITVAICAFWLAPTVLPENLKQKLASSSSTPLTTDDNGQTNLIRRMWTVKSSKNKNALLGIACSIIETKTTKKDGCGERIVYRSFFVPGSYVKESINEKLAQKVRDMLDKQLILNGLFPPGENQNSCLSQMLENNSIFMVAANYQFAKFFEKSGPWQKYDPHEKPINNKPTTDEEEPKNFYDELITNLRQKGEIRNNIYNSLGRKFLSGHFKIVAS